MQQNGQEQQERGQQPEQESEQNISAAASQKADECMELLRRTQADFVNYRRRMTQEQAEARVAAQSTLLAQLLPVLDDLERALSTAPQELVANPWTQGLLLVARRLTMQLDRLGVRKIGTPGEPFDPYLHEAISTEARSDVPEGTILHVARPGYTLGERVIRPAQVTVARASSLASEVQGQHGNTSKQ